MTPLRERVYATVGVTMLTSAICIRTYDTEKAMSVRRETDMSGKYEVATAKLRDYSTFPILSLFSIVFYFSFLFFYLFLFHPRDTFFRVSS